MKPRVFAITLILVGILIGAIGYFLFMKFYIPNLLG